MHACRSIDMHCVDLNKQTCHVIYKPAKQTEAHNVLDDPSL